MQYGLTSYRWCWPYSVYWGCRAGRIVQWVTQQEHCHAWANDRLKPATKGIVLPDYEIFSCKCSAGFFSDPNLAYTVLTPMNEAFEDAAEGRNMTLTEFMTSPELKPILENHLLASPLTVRLSLCQPCAVLPSCRCGVIDSALLARDHSSSKGKYGITYKTEYLKCLLNRSRWCNWTCWKTSPL